MIKQCLTSQAEQTHLQRKAIHYSEDELCGFYAINSINIITV